MTHFCWGLLLEGFIFSHHGGTPLHHWFNPFRPSPCNDEIVCHLVVHHFQNFSGKSGWKVNKAQLFGSFRWKISGSNETSEKVVLFSGRNVPNGNSCSISSKPSLISTSFSLLRQFFGNCNWLVHMVNAISGRNLPVLNFAYPLVICLNHEPTGLPL